MKVLYVALLTLLAGCASTPSWQQTYSAPYNAAASEEEARIWKKTDEVFQDRADFVAQGKFEGERVHPRPVAQPGPVLTAALEKERGVVVVAYMIERDGSVRDARIIESSNRLDLAMLRGTFVFKNRALEPLAGTSWLHFKRTGDTPDRGVDTIQTGRTDGGQHPKASNTTSPSRISERN